MITYGTNPPDRLRASVEALTNRYSIRVVRDDGSTARIRHHPRLQQLHAAVHSSTNKDGGGKAARERNIINTTALDLETKITKHINDAATTIGANIHNDPAKTLQRWLIRARQKITSNQFENEWASNWEHDAQSIDKLLNPPRTREITRPCPQCGERYAIDPQQQTRITALVIEYYNSGQKGIEGARVTCRFCGETGFGLTQLRAWAYGIEQAEKAAISHT